MRVSETTSANFSGSAAKPGAITRITAGMKISAATTKANSAANSTAKASSAKSRAACLPLSAKAPAASGTKAALNAPSANRLRNRLGRRWATKNASATGPAPRIAAVNTSRMKPKTRLNRVNEPTVAAERKSAIARGVEENRPAVMAGEGAAAPAVRFRSVVAGRAARTQSCAAQARGGNYGRNQDRRARLRRPHGPHAGRRDRRERGLYPVRRQRASGQPAGRQCARRRAGRHRFARGADRRQRRRHRLHRAGGERSEEHTSELQSRGHLV